MTKEKQEDRVHPDISRKLAHPISGLLSWTYNLHTRVLDLEFPSDAFDSRLEVTASASLKTLHHMLSGKVEEFIRDMPATDIAIADGINRELEVNEKTHGIPNFLLLLRAKKQSDVDFNGVLINVTSELRGLTSREVEKMNLVQTGRLAALAQMAGGIAHEINNPLTILMGHAQFATTNAGSENCNMNQLQFSLRKISETGLRISTIVKTLRALSRKEDQDFTAKVCVKDVICDSLELVRQKLMSSTIALSESFDRDDICIYGNATALSQITLNLLHNSIDAVNSQSEDATRWIKITVQEKGNKCIFRITDSGAGIPIEIRDKIMDPFFSTKPPGQGTGLGLSLTQTLVQRQNGSIKLDQESLHTCFQIEFPAVLEAHSDSGAA